MDTLKTDGLPELQFHNEGPELNRAALGVVTVTALLIAARITGLDESFNMSVSPVATGIIGLSVAGFMAAMKQVIYGGKGAKMVKDIINPPHYYPQ